MSSWNKQLMAGFSIAVMAILGGVAAAPANAAPELKCDLRVDYPHGSTHVSGTINVVAQVTCPMKMGSMQLETQLERVSPIFVWPGATKTGTGPTLSGNAATSCTNGPDNFRGWARAKITAPKGYVLTGTGTMAEYGYTQAVACGDARMAAPDGQFSDRGSEVVASITFKKIS